MFSDSFVILSRMVKASTRDNKLSLPGVQSQSGTYTKVQSNTSAAWAHIRYAVCDMFKNATPRSKIYKDNKCADHTGFGREKSQRYSFGHQIIELPHFSTLTNPCIFGLDLVTWCNVLSLSFRLQMVT